MDQALKQRLVGASVLIVLAIILIPMLLSGRPEGQNEVRRVQVSPKPAELSFETRRFPIGSQAGEEPSQLPAPDKSRQPARGVNGAAPTAGGPAGERAQAGDTGPAPELRADRGGPGVQPEPPMAPGRYLVQVASFSNTGNATNLASVLRQNGMPVLMDQVETNAGRLHRVRVGPYDHLADADRSAERLRALISDLNPRVLDLRPDESAPVTEPSDPLVRWAVQAGSFSDQANADSLVKRLREAGFTAYGETVSGPDGSVYKVRIGPVIERGNALELAAELQRVMSIEGLVTSVD